MSDDPETARQISELAGDTRPLLVLDVDEVVLEFVRPFAAFADGEGFAFRTESFRLTGNVVAKETGEIASQNTVSALLDGFFAAQEDWQYAADGAAETISALAEHAEIVMLTAMPHAYRDRRRRLLDRLAIPHPLVTTERAKGPAVALLAGERTSGVAFVDDIPHNHISVAGAYPRAALFHLMAHEGMRGLLGPLPEGVSPVDNWAAAETIIAEALGIGL